MQQKLQDASALGGNAFLLYVLNPMAIVIQGFQRALYGDPAPIVDGVRQQVLFDWTVSEVALALAIVLVGRHRAAVVHVATVLPDVRRLRRGAVTR